MKITIDTKEDSKEEIKRAIGLLSSLVKEEVRIVLPKNNEVSGGAFANMFGDRNEVKGRQEEISVKNETEGTPMDFSKFTSLMGNSEKEKKDKPQVISY